MKIIESLPVEQQNFWPLINLIVFNLHDSINLISDKWNLIVHAAVTENSLKVFSNTLSQVFFSIKESFSS